MAGNFQDDLREDTMRKIFNLYKDDAEGRSGIDAFLEFNGESIPFELKTTSNGSVTTVRDFGPDHISKWKNKHWLIGFFINGSEHYKYASPLMMEAWIKEKENYIAPDFKLANLSSSKLTIEDMFSILGKKDSYSIEDAKSIQKMQYRITDYIKLQDLKNGYSPERMLEILKDRNKYLVQRGSTLNNPHIPHSYFNELPEITIDHASELRMLVEEFMQSRSKI